MQPQDGNGQIALVAVAAILVASVRLNCLGARFNLRKRGANPIEVDARYHRGDELGWFQHGSTIVLFATKGHALLPHIREGAFVRMGEPLLARPATATSTQTETP